MIPNKSSLRAQAVKRESRSDRTNKDKKIDKEKTAAAVRQINKDEKYRSGSLSRNLPGTSRESPRKSQSVDRKPVNRSTVITLNSKNGSSSKTNTTPIRKKPLITSKAPSSKNENTKKDGQKSRSTSKNDTSNNNPQKTRATERRTNAQIAKSFVQNVSSKPKKLVSEKSVSKVSKTSKNINNRDENLNYERPRTSTIKKHSTVVLDDYRNEDNGLKDGQDSLSKSKTRLEVGSDDDKQSYEEDFEDYNSDFEESDSVESDSESSYESSESEEENIEDIEENDAALVISLEESKPPVKNKSTPEFLANKKSGEKTFLKMSDRSSLNRETESEKETDRRFVKSSRSYINFASAMETEERKINVDQTMNNLEEEFTSDVPINITDALMNAASLRRSMHNAKQVYVQTENYETEEIQTDEIEMSNKWTQNPLNGTLGYGGDKVFPIEDRTSNWKLLFSPHSVKLSSFLQKSSHIMLTLLDEEFSTNDSFLIKKKQDFFQSDGYYSLSPLSFLKDVSVANIYSCTSSFPYIFTIHGNMVKLPFPNDCDEEKGIICVWNVYNSKKPEHILTANSQPICGTFGPGGNDIVISGMVDGAVMLWDLTNFNSNIFIEESGESLPLLTSTYNTALILSSENHRSCIVRIHAVFNQTEVSWKSTSSHKGSYSKNFHVLTLEDMGVINVWVVVEVLKPDISGTETDLGLAPGGKYRLVRSSCINLQNFPSLPLEQKVNMRTFDFQLIPHDSSQMLVTTDIGLVLHVARHSGSVEPRYYSSDPDFSHEVRCIDCSPHNRDLFLVGCNDGSIKLYNMKIVRPLLEFVCSEKGESVNLLQWSTVHPTVFYVLSSSSCLYLWDLIEDSLHPIQNYQFQDSKITWFVSQTVIKKFHLTTSAENSNFIVSKENGEVEVHTFQHLLSNDNYVKQLNFMDNL